jgi:O-antigen biosynthesis protein
VIYGGVFGRGLFQTLYQPPASFFGYLPFTFEWNATAALLLALALARGSWAWAGLAALPLAVTWACCLGAALRARVDARADDVRGRLLIALLTYLGPLLRCVERYRWWVRSLSAAEPVKQTRPRALPLSWRECAFLLSYWTDHGLEKETILHGLHEAVTARKYFVVVDQGWSDWDLEVHGGLWSRALIKVATENHGGERRVLRIKCALRASRLALACLVSTILVAALGIKLGFLPFVLTVAAAVVGIAIVREGRNLGRMLHGTIQTVARRARLHYARGLAEQTAEVK